MIASKIFLVAHYIDQVVLWLLLVLSVVSLAIIIERFVVLGRIAAMSKKIRERVKIALQSHSVDDFEGIAKEVDSFEGRGAAYALRHLKETGSKGVEEVFNTYALNQKPDLEKFLGFLGTMASNAPYIGLFGTVLGIMKAFNDLSVSTEAGSQTVMAGISLALVATAAGLFVAIPAVMAFNFYNKRVKMIMISLESVKELCLAYAKKKGL